jgi:hypothetical protein
MRLSKGPFGEELLFLTKPVFSPLAFDFKPNGCLCKAIKLKTKGYEA